MTKYSSTCCQVILFSNVVLCCAVHMAVYELSFIQDAICCVASVAGWSERRGDVTCMPSSYDPTSKNHLRSIANKPPAIVGDTIGSAPTGTCSHYVQTGCGSESESVFGGEVSAEYIDDHVRPSKQAHVISLH